MTDITLDEIISVMEDKEFTRWFDNRFSYYSNRGKETHPSWNKELMMQDFERMIKGFRKRGRVHHTDIHTT